MAEVIDFNKALRQQEVDALLNAPTATSRLEADDIASRVRADIQRFVEWLFSGRAYIDVRSHEARIGSKHGEPGESCRVSLSGPNAGMWYDFASGEGGNIF